MHHFYILTTRPKLRNKLKRYTIFLIVLFSVFIGYQQILKLRGSKAEGVNPTISSITPNSGPTIGGTVVTINGTDFSPTQYQRSISITNNGSTLTNYEASFSFDTASLISAGKMRSDCGDVRVKDTDGTTDLNYWVDGGCNTTTTVVWAKIPSIAANSTKTIYVTYGNGSLVTASNITNFSFGTLLAGSNNKMWLKAHDGTSTTTNGLAISSWTDKSGTGNNATQATSTKQPTFQTNVLNGLPAVTFSAATGQTLTNSTNFTTPYSMIYVSKQTGGANSRVVSGLNNNWLLGYWGGNKDQFHPTGWVNNPSTPSDTSWHLYTGMGTGSLSTLFHNGTQLASNAGGLAGPNGISLNGNAGSSEFSNAQITEFLIFNTALSSTDRQLIEDYLNNKYRLYNTSSMPTVAVSSTETGGALNIKFDTTNSTSIQYVSSTQVTAVVPAHAPGSVNVTVVNPGNLVSTNSVSYTYASPTISSISPSTGPNSGGTYVTITGSNFGSNSYRRSLTVSNSASSALTNYQISTSLDTAALIAAGKMRSDCGDIRIKDSDGTTDLAYWIETGCNTSATKIWTKVSSIAANSFKTVYVTYGDNTLTSQSNGSNVFDFFDDFSGSNINTSKWTEVDTAANYLTQNNKIQVSGGATNWTSVGMYSTPTFNRSDNVEIEADWKWTGGQLAMIGWKNTSATVDLTTFPHAFYVNNSSGTDDIYENGVNQGDSGKNWVLNQQYKLRIVLTPTNGAIYQRSTDGGITWETWMTTTGLTTSPVKVAFTNYSESFELDNVVVRRYAATEPSLLLGNELGVVTITIGSTTVTGTVTNSTTANFYTPAGTGLQNISIANSDGSSSNSYSGFSYGGTTVPNPIINLNTTGSDNGQVSLGWTAPFDNGSSITDYVIKYSSNSDMSNSTTYNDGVSSNTTAIVNGLSNGMTYYFQVYPVNNQGTGLGSNILSSVVDCDTNLGGADFSPTNGTTLTGRYCNIGTFTVGSGITISLSQAVVVKIYANTVNINGTLSGVGKGYSGVASSNGNGAGGGLTSSRSGGSYGGVGSSGVGGPFSTTYGSITQPIDLGSAGGACTQRGGNGGGAIKLVVSGTLTLNGTITTKGEDGLYIGSGCNSGGGSGGSVWLDAGTFAGSGTIGADGGNTINYNSGSGAGGGGRIAMYYTTKTFNGAVTAKGGTYDSGLYYGGPGTVYEKSASQTNGNVRIDNGLYVQQVATPLDSSISYNDVTIGVGKVDGSAAALTITGTLTVNNLGTLILGTTNTQSINAIIVNSGGTIEHKANTTTKNHVLNIISLTITINSGGKIDTSAKGYAGGAPNSGSGSGAGGGIGSGGPGGGGYGGVGGNGSQSSGGPTYGSISKPVDLGSGGGSCGTMRGGNGGGAIKLIVKGTLTINGNISSNGESGLSNAAAGCYSGGGSGGSIWIDTDVLEGSGLLAVNGGGSQLYYSQGASGGGGRIALYYKNKTYSGLSTATKGTHGSATYQGTDGTVYEVTSIFTADMVDNSGVSISNPTVTMSTTSPQYNCNTVTGTLGTSTQKIRLTNTTSNPLWSVSIAPTAGSSATWNTGSQNYDFNDATSSGCTDGSDTDSVGGQLTVNPSTASMSISNGCTTTGLSLGSQSSYAEGTLNSINLLSAGSSADTGCNLDLTNIGLSQTIPSQQSSGTYSLPMTITIVAN